MRYKKATKKHDHFLEMNRVTKIYEKDKRKDEIKNKAIVVYVLIRICFPLILITFVLIF